MLLLIGSRGWNTWVPRSFDTEKSDWDLIGTVSDLDNLVKTLPGIKSAYPSSPIKYKIKRHNAPMMEFEIIENVPSSKYLHELVTKHPKIVPSKKVEGFFPYTVAPSLPALMLTKRSTAYWDVHWFKTMDHLAFMKTSIISHTLHPKLIKYYQMRLAENQIKFGRIRKAKLNMKNEEFFNKSEPFVNRVFEHDSLHEAVRFYDRPVYEMAKKDKSSAMMDYEMWRDLRPIFRIKAVQEEASVIALERFIIPKLMNKSYVPTKKEMSDYYLDALKLLVTRMTSGWFRDFIINNWKDVKFPGQDYVTRFDHALKQGHLVWNQKWIEQNNLAEASVLS